MLRVTRLIAGLSLLVVACGGRALDESDVENNRPQEPDHDGERGGALVGSGGVVVVVGAGGHASGGAPSAGGDSWGTGSGPVDCPPDEREHCVPGECVGLEDPGSLAIDLDQACDAQGGLVSSSASQGCGYVALQWTGDVADGGVTFYEIVEGQTIGGDAHHGSDTCPVTWGTIPDCAHWFDIDPCGDVDKQAWCEDARQLSQDYFDELRAEATSCEIDDDCSMVSFGMECGTICPLSLNKYEIGTLGTAFYEFDDGGICGACSGIVPFGCPEPPFESQCIDGQCQLAGDYAANGLFAPFEE